MVSTNQSFAIKSQPQTSNFVKSRGAVALQDLTANYEHKCEAQIRYDKHFSSREELSFFVGSESLVSDGTSDSCGALRSPVNEQTNGACVRYGVCCCRQVWRQWVTLSLPGHFHFSDETNRRITSSTSIVSIRYQMGGKKTETYQQFLFISLKASLFLTSISHQSIYADSLLPQLPGSSAMIHVSQNVFVNEGRDTLWSIQHLLKTPLALSHSTSKKVEFFYRVVYRLET